MSKIGTRSTSQQQPDDMPFGVAGERRRMAMARSEKDKPSLVSIIREAIAPLRQKERELWEQLEQKRRESDGE